MFEYSVQVLRVIDGDTLDVEVDLGFRVFVKERIRLLGVDTPEIHGPKAKTEKEAGEAAKAFVEFWVAEHPALILRSYDGKALGQGKYGRWLGVLTPVGGGDSLNDTLLATGHAVPLEY